MPLPPKQHGPKDIPPESERSETSSEPHSKRAPPLPAARDDDKLAEAIAEMRTSNSSFEETANRFHLDPELLRRWARSNRQAEQNQIAVSPRLGETPAQDVAEHDRDTYSDNWHRATEGVDKVEVLSNFEAVLNTFPPLRLLFGTERRRVLTAITFGLAALTAVVALSQQRAAPAPTIAPPPTPPTDVIKLPSIDERKAAGELAHAFLSADGWAAKRAFVTSPERLDTIAEEWYSRPENEHFSQSADAIEILDTFGSTNRGQRYSIVLTDSSCGEIIFVINFPYSGDPKIFWKQTVCYSSTSWDDFVAARDTKPATFYVRSSRNDYFNTPFDDEQTFLSYRLVSIDPSAETLFGFGRRDSELGERLLRLHQGFTHLDLVLELRHPESGTENCVEILSIISDAWINDR